MHLRRNSDPKEKTALRHRDTAMAMSFILLIVYFTTQIYWLLYLLAATLLMGMIFPSLFKPLSLLWFGLGEKLGSFTSRLILFLAYLGFVSPMAILKKGHFKQRFYPEKQSDCTSLQFDNGDKGHLFTKEDITKPY